MKGIKKLTAISLCAILAITAMPLAAFAADEAYIEIKFADEKKGSIAFGETEELYIEYSAGECGDYEIVWSVSDSERLKIEYVTDVQTGHITRAKITGSKFGTYTITVKIIDENGNEIVSADRLFYVVESDNKSFEEKVHIFLRDANFLAFFTTLFIIFPIVAGPIVTPISLMIEAIKDIFE